MPERAPLDLVAEPIEDLATLVHRRRRRQDALEGRLLGDPECLKWIERADGSYPADDEHS
jgi:hypothetical protein